MIRKIFIWMGLALAIQVSAQSQSQSEVEIKVLTLSETIDVAHEQSLMALMSRHQFRSSYWEYRSYQASKGPD